MLRQLPKLALPALTFVLVCGFRCDPEVPIGENDAGASDGGAVVLDCVGENPAGCVSDADCAPGDLCVTGTHSSACSCDPDTGSWQCTPDLAGGECQTQTCDGPNPAGCTSDAECGAEEICRTGSRSSECTCEPTAGDWVCTRDLGGGDCVSDTCPDPGDPKVVYHGYSNEECARVIFNCEGDQEAFGSDCGCGCRPISPPDCGDASCDYASQYCEAFTGGAPGSTTTYSCQPLPTACASAPSCAACFPSGGPEQCEERTEGLRVSIFGA